MITIPGRTMIYSKAKVAYVCVVEMSWRFATIYQALVKKREVSNSFAVCLVRQQLCIKSKAKQQR